MTNRRELSAPFEVFKDIKKFIEDGKIEIAREKLRRVRADNRSNVFPIKQLYHKYKGLIEYHSNNRKIWILCSFLAMGREEEKQKLDLEEIRRMAALLPENEVVDLTKWSDRTEIENFPLPISISCGFEEKYFFAHREVPMRAVIQSSFINEFEINDLQIEIVICEVSGEETVERVNIGDSFMVSRKSRIFERKALQKHTSVKSIRVVRAFFRIEKLTCICELANKVFWDDLYEKTEQITTKDGFSIDVQCPPFGIVDEPCPIVIKASVAEGRPESRFMFNVREFSSCTEMVVPPGTTKECSVQLKAEQDELNREYQLDFKVETNGIPAELINPVKFNIPFHEPFDVQFINYDNNSKYKVAINERFIIEMNILLAVKVGFNITRISIDAKDADVKQVPLELPFHLSPGECFHVVAFITPRRVFQAYKPLAKLRIEYEPDMYFAGSSCEYEFPNMLVYESPLSVSLCYNSTICEFEQQIMEISLKSESDRHQTFKLKIAESDKIMIDGFTDLDVGMMPGSTKVIPVGFFAMQAGEYKFPKIQLTALDNMVIWESSPELFVIYGGN